ncbi:hypothetical protein FOA52_013429 [Chlamydomonas sp. UWO 241]|nr:hypothetical protein FOA52_013429 [Chlamydomonas sp. UWO 241]
MKLESHALNAVWELERRRRQGAMSYRICRHEPPAEKAIQDFAMDILCDGRFPSMDHGMQDGYLGWRDASAPTDKAALRKWIGAKEKPTPTVEVGFGTRVAYHRQHQAGMGRRGRLVPLEGRDPGFPCVLLEGPGEARTDLATAQQLVVVCEACGRASEGIKRCSGCNLSFDCSEACQRSHWKAHKKICKEEAARRADPL